MNNLEKLMLVFNVEVKSTGRRTYVNLHEADVKACRIKAGDMLTIQLKGILRKTEEG